MAFLSAFADEVTDSFPGQVKYLASENIGFIETRFVDKKNVMDLTSDELNEAKKIMADHGIKVCAIGSPIGKVNINESFAPHLEKFKHALGLAEFFEAPFIRMFSYYPPDGKDIDDYRDRVIERLTAKTELLKDSSVVMVHENETGIYGYSAKNCVDIVKSVNSEKLRLVYDSGNFVWGQKITDNITNCWPLMKPYVVHIHIKDWKLNADIGSIPGQGDGQIKELLAELVVMEYDGFITMEPHLKVGGRFGGQTGAKLFSKAVSAVRQLATETGLKLD